MDDNWKRMVGMLTGLRPLTWVKTAMICAALTGCGSGPLWEQRSDGYVSPQLYGCAMSDCPTNPEDQRHCILLNFKMQSYDKPYLEKLGFRCGFTDQYCLLHHTGRQYGMTLLGRDDNGFFEHRTDIYLKYVDQKLSVFKIRYESVDGQGKVRCRYETADTLP